jgi:SAM-dependent methyltransferase
VNELADVSDLLGQDVWLFAALTSFLGDAASTSVAEAQRADPHRTEMLLAAGIIGNVSDSPGLRPRSEAMLAVFHQAHAAAVRAVGSGPIWRKLPDEALQNQGSASAVTGAMLIERIVPQLEGLDERLSRAGGRILDVGTGVGGWAIAVAEHLPEVTVTGIDVFPRALQLASQRLNEADPKVRNRVEFRLLDANKFDEQNGYDMAWLPVQFLAEDSVPHVIDRVLQALRPDGWLIVGTFADPGSALARATASWTASLNGGSTGFTRDIEGLLAARRARTIQHHPTMPGGPVLVTAQPPLRGTTDG